MDPKGLTAAHKTLPFGTRLKVENKDNGDYVIVVINDRGPFIEGREIDLSKKAFAQIASLDQGICEVRITNLSDQPK